MSEDNIIVGLDLPPSSEERMDRKEEGEESGVNADITVGLELPSDVAEDDGDWRKINWREEIGEDLEDEEPTEIPKGRGSREANDGEFFGSLRIDETKLPPGNWFFNRLECDGHDDCWNQIYAALPPSVSPDKTLIRMYGVYPTHVDALGILDLIEDYLDNTFTVPPRQGRRLTSLQKRAYRLLWGVKVGGIHQWLTLDELRRVTSLHPLKDAKEIVAIVSRGYQRRSRHERRQFGVTKPIVYLKDILHSEFHKVIESVGPQWSGKPLRFWLQGLTNLFTGTVSNYSVMYRVRYLQRGRQPRSKVEKRRVWRRILRKLLLKHPRVHYIWGRVYWGDEYAGRYLQSPPLSLPPKDAPLPVKIHCVMSHREFRRKLPNDNFSVWAPTVAKAIGESTDRVRSYLRWWITKMCAGDHILFKRFPFLVDSIRRALRANWEDFSSWWRSEVEDLRAQGVVDYPSVSSCAIKLTQYLLGSRVNVNTRYALLKAVSRVIRCMPEFTVTRRPGGLRGRRGYVVRRIRQFHRNLNRSTFVQAHRRLHLIKKLFPQQLWKRIRWRNSWLWNPYLEIWGSQYGDERRRISVSGYVPGGCSFVPPVFSHAREGPGYWQRESALASTVQSGGPPP